MNYIQKVRQRLDEVGDIGDSDLLDLYTLLVFTKGVDVTWKDVHDAWAIWRNNSNPEHKSIIPYEELSLEVQMLDKEYADAIEKVAYEFGFIFS